MKLNSHNPQIIELTKTLNSRYVAKSYVKRVPGLCKWCYEVPTKGLRHYCSHRCSLMLEAWAYPQSEFGLWVLLTRQDHKCAACQYQYDKQESSYRDHIYRHYAVLKSKCPEDRKPEVDHIIPISKGGESLGFNNHQVLCYTCHKAKTKIDNSKPKTWLTL